MKFTSLLILCILEIAFVFETYAQLPEPPVPLPPQQEEIFKVVEEMPRFPGFEDMGGSSQSIENCAKEKMLQYIYERLKYPEGAKKNNVEGMAVIQFKIWKDSTIRDVKIVRDPGAGTGAAAAQIVESMNDMDQKWRPGHQRGRAVCVQYTLPVKFKLDKPFPSHSRSDDVVLLSDVDESPLFPDCQKYKDPNCTKESLLEFIKENQLYPEAALKNKTEGTVKISFIIEEDGTLTNIKAHNQPPDGLSQDAVEIIRWMNSEDMRWTPGMQDYNPVRTLYYVDIMYDISDWNSRN